MKPKIKALLPYFGSARMVAEKIGPALAGLDWIGIPFMGGLPELAYMTARTVVANDLHRGVVNLAAVVGDPVLGIELRSRLKLLPYHTDVLRSAQQRCRVTSELPRLADAAPSLQFAIDYFVCAWMGRSGKAGTAKEFDGELPVRWNANGGDSCVRFRSALQSLREWNQILARVNFTCMDGFEFLAKCKDEVGHGIYVDAPWPDDGDEYRFAFDETKQRDLAMKLHYYEKTKVVIRYGEHPLIRELYPESEWIWTEISGRTSGNNRKAEVLIVGRWS